MKSYVIYRIACTICLLMFVFFSQILFNAKAPVTPINISPTTPYWYGYPFVPDFTAFNYVQSTAGPQTSNPVLVDFERAHGYAKPMPTAPLSQQMTQLGTFYSQFSSKTPDWTVATIGTSPSTMYGNILKDGTTPPLYVQTSSFTTATSATTITSCGATIKELCTTTSDCKSWSVNNQFARLQISLTQPACYINCNDVVAVDSTYLTSANYPCNGDVFMPQYIGYEGSSAVGSNYASNAYLGTASNTLYFPQTDPKYPHFGMPAIVLVILTILNDGTIISIAYDHVIASPKPEKWRLGIVLVVCAVLGGIAFAELFLFYILLAGGTPTYIGKVGELTQAETNFYGGWQSRMGAYNPTTMTFDVPSTPKLPLTQGQVTSAIYLLLSMGGQAIVFQARTDSWFFSRKPGFALGIAFMTSQTISILFSNYWFFADILEPIGLPVWTTCPGVSPYQSLIPDTFKQFGSYTPAQRTFFAPTMLVRYRDATGADSSRNMPVWAQFADGSSQGLCLSCSNANTFGNGVDIDMKNPGPAGAVGSITNPLKCFQHGTPNSWVLGLTVIWAAGWFLGGDIAKVITYYLINNYYLDAADEVCRVQSSCFSRTTFLFARLIFILAISFYALTLRF